MKDNHTFLSAILVSMVAFVLYFHTTNHLQNTSLKIIEDKQTTTYKNHGKEPKTIAKAPELTTDVHTSKSSDKKLAKVIKKVMGTSGPFQVAVLDLNKKRSTEVYNTKTAMQASDVLRLYVELGLFDQMAKKKITSGTAWAVKQADLAKNETMFQAGIMYGTSYYRQAMMSSRNVTAANMILNKVTAKKVVQAGKKFGATDLTITGKFGDAAVGQVGAKSLAMTFKNLYQNKVLPEYTSLALNSLRNWPQSSLTTQIPSALYQISDAKHAVCLVQSGSDAWILAVSADNSQKFAQLGQAVNAELSK